MVNISESGDPDETLWVPQIDYLSAWRRAAVAADTLNVAAASCGLDVVRALPHAGARGEAVVWLHPDGARELAHVLTLWDRAWRVR
ncbi:hypothetical protein [Streptomyces lasiicapitis]|uniref:Uncharacterized protein n=1 Tax=Streptomyces lasiicapitis TaxID=1923961 RepID=A0ABQ2LIS1_9ACTN|nr:hypothetical protein [Streptomyces lasiicapitis]GGO35686.1 hypothetical protein GCM10012286_06700 [Streptomyces lasiicapitis]